MSKIAIIIPSRLQAIRLPDKPLKTINNKEMIVHVLEVATKADMGDVIVATPDQKIVEVVKKNNGKAVITKFDHETGTDRIFEVFEKVLNKEPEIIINLQGDMPNLDPLSIKHLINHMEKKTCDIGTLASDLLKKKVNEIGWKLSVEQDILSKWFSSNYKQFVHYGRDMEHLLTCVKICHGRRIYGKDKELRKLITIDDLNTGYDEFVSSNKSKSVPTYLQSIYI